MTVRKLLTAVTTAAIMTAFAVPALACGEEGKTASKDSASKPVAVADADSAPKKIKKAGKKDDEAKGAKGDKGDNKKGGNLKKGKGGKAKGE